MNKQLFGNVLCVDTPIYFGLFSNAEDVFSNYGVGEEQQEGIDIIFAEYEYEEYSGSSLVIFIKDGKLYEVNGSHCSCNGLEDCWSPEETSAIALLARPNVPDPAKANLRKFYKNLMSFL